MWQSDSFVSSLDEHAIFYLFKVTPKGGQKKACALKLKQNIKTNL